MYQLLVGQRGWSLQLYERVLSDTWQRLLLADEGPETSYAGRLMQLRSLSKTGWRHASSGYRLSYMTLRP